MLATNRFKNNEVTMTGHQRSSSMRFNRGHTILR